MSVPATLYNPHLVLIFIEFLVHGSSELRVRVGLEEGDAN